MENKETVFKDLSEILIKSKVLKNEPMKEHTSFKIGGPADVFVIAEDENELKSVISYCRERGVALTLTGNGSNILVSDKGIRGVTLKLGAAFSKITAEGNIITAGSGALLSKVASVAAANSLSGMEFASGIPGSLGGAIYMNAGAYDGEMKDITESVVFLGGDFCIKTISGSECDFSYRHSIFKETGNIILSVYLKLDYEDKEKITEKMKELSKKRNEKQPTTLPSGGSTFKRPQGYFAAKLIDDCGLRGERVGGASVSEKHTGFVVNDMNATCDDVLKLIEKVKKTVFEKTGVMLCEEIIFLGER